MGEQLLDLCLFFWEPTEGDGLTLQANSHLHMYLKIIIQNLCIQRPYEAP